MCDGDPKPLVPVLSLLAFLAFFSTKVQKLTRQELRKVSDGDAKDLQAQRLQAQRLQAERSPTSLPTALTKPLCAQH